MGANIASQNPDYTISNLSADIRSAYNKKVTQHSSQHDLQAKQGFFKFSSENRTAIEQQIGLLADVARDNHFQDKDEDYKSRVEDYYRKYKKTLHQDAVLGDNFANITIYAPKSDKNAKSSNTSSAVTNKIRKDTLDLIYMFLHTSMLQKFLNFINKYRVTLIFYRFTWMSFWSLAAKLDWLDRDGNLAGIYIDQDGLRDFGEVFLAYSLAIYGLRLLMVIGLVLKHLFIPTDAEKCRKPLERLYLEIKKHWYFFINDTAKEIITFMILFPEFFNLASVYIPLLTGALVLLDLIKSIYRLIKESLVYKQTKEDLEKQLSALDSNKEQVDIQIIKQMQVKLELQHLEKMSKFLLSLIMNILMLSSFIALTIVAPYVVIPALFFFCVLCRVLDVTSDKFGAYMRSRRESQHEPHNQQLAEQRSEKLKEFGIAFLKTLLIPMILVGLLVINWQLALIITAVYLTAEYAYSCSKPKPVDKVEQAFFNNTSKRNHIATDEYDPIAPFCIS